MNRKTKLICLLIVLVVLLPLWMWLAWLLTPKKKYVMAIVDKTVITTGGQEHASLTWVLNHERLAKTSTQLYSVASDYFGFFPLQNEAFKIKGLERFTSQQLEQLSNDCKAVYFTDTYGIYSNEWYTGKNVSERSGIVYGGMSKEDIELLKKMKAKRKVIITEFNAIGSPTAPDIRQQFESLFALKWTGWTGRYFGSLDTSVNKELPKWLVNNYLRQNNNKWPFKKAGVAFVSTGDEVVILEEGTHLQNPLPHIITLNKGREIYDLPEKMKYAFWFDVVQPDTSINEVIADFTIDANTAGKQVLKQHNIPSVFPAVTQHIDKDYQFYYFSADFCDNPVTMTSSYFTGISLFRSFFYNHNDPEERKSFFWNYYRPLITGILTGN